MADLYLTVGGNTISAGLLMARATARCTAKGPATGGSSELAGLVVNGQAVSATRTPNQRVDVPDNGEPDRRDTITLRLSTGYAASGKLAGGNLQLQKPCQ